MFMITADRSMETCSLSGLIFHKAIIKCEKFSITYCSRCVAPPTLCGWAMFDAEFLRQAIVRKLGDKSWWWLEQTSPDKFLILNCNSPLKPFPFLGLPSIPMHGKGIEQLIGKND